MPNAKIARTAQRAAALRLRELPRRFPDARAVLLLLLTAGIVVSGAPVRGADVEERTDAAAGRLPGNCQLPVAIRKFSEGRILPVPGNVIRTSRQDCTTRGGRYLPAPPEGAAPKPG